MSGPHAFSGHNYLVFVALKVNHRQEDSRRIVEQIHDEKTDRVFLLTYFKDGASLAADAIERMSCGLAGHWHASEMRPTGDLSLDEDRFVHVEREPFRKALSSPSKTYRLVGRFAKNHPEGQIVRAGGGRGSRSIYHPDRVGAVTAMGNALLSDTWLIESEPPRPRKIGRVATIDTEDDNAFRKTPGRPIILQALAKVEEP